MSSASPAEQYHDTDVSEWAFEPADRSVGIDSDGYWHEQCPRADTLQPGDDLNGTVTRTRDGLRITCPQCGGMLHLDDNSADGPQ
jgi:hypothetical protein